MVGLRRNPVEPCRNGRIIAEPEAAVRGDMGVGVKANVGEAERSARQRIQDTLALMTALSKRTNRAEERLARLGRPNTQGEFDLDKKQRFTGIRDGIAPIPRPQPTMPAITSSLMQFCSETT